MILILYIKQYLVDIGIAHSRTPRSPRRLRISPNRGKDWWRFFSVPPNYPISSLATPIGLLVLFDLQSSLLLRQIRVAVLVLGGLMGRKIRSIWMTDGLQPDFQTWKWNKPRNQLVNRSVPMFRTSGRSQAACSTSYRGDLYPWEKWKQWRFDLTFSFTITEYPEVHWNQEKGRYDSKGIIELDSVWYGADCENEIDMHWLRQWYIGRFNGVSWIEGL